MILFKDKIFLTTLRMIVLILMMWFIVCGMAYSETENHVYRNMIFLESGCFEMGSEEFVTEEPIHKVCVSSFYLDKFEVTQENFEAVMRVNPSTHQGKALPVVNVSWIDAEQYCRKRGGRLPSEAEWEYANRGGKSFSYFWGDNMDGDYAWFQENSSSVIHPVGEKKPNPWGFHDMSGNVWEWVADWYREDYYEMSAKMDPDNNPQGPPSGQFLLVRGGSYKDDPFFLRSATRFWYEPIIKANDLGFRCAADPEKS